MAISLLEASRVAYNQGKERLSEIILQFAQSSPLMTTIPFQTINGGSLEFPVESRLPDISWRGVNEGFPEDTGETKLVTESCSLGGGDLDVDTAIVRRMGNEIRPQYERQKIRALALTWEKTFIKGDRITNPKEFNGLQNRLTGSTKQLIAAGNTNGGDPLSLMKLDEAYSRVLNPTHWIMSREQALLLTAVVRNSSVAGFVTFQQDQLGRKQMYYAGLPVIEIDEDAQGNAIMGYTEACPGGGTTGTSVYLVSFGDMMLTGIQSNDMETRDLGELQTKPVFRTRVEWDSGIALINPKSLVRIWGIKKAAMVA